MTDIKLDRMVITPEVFRIVEEGGYINIQPAYFDPEDNRPEPEHAALYDQNGVFVDWLC
jgi:hypothetical protein